MRSLFISYARTDRAQVEALASDLQALGHRVWFDRELTGGQHWWEGILKAIRDADVFVFVASRDAARSVACRRELEYAIALSLPILPVALQPLREIGALPPFVESLHIIDYSHAGKAEAMSLARALDASPQRGAVPDPLPAPPPWPAAPMSELHHQVQSDAPMSLEAQSVWLLRLRDEVEAGASPRTACEALAVFLQRRDLFAMTGREAEKLAKAWSSLTGTNSPAGSGSDGAPASPPAATHAPRAGKPAGPGPVLQQLSPAAMNFPRANAPSTGATRSTGIPPGMRGSKAMRYFAVTLLPILAYVPIVAFGLRDPFWMPRSIYSLWMPVAAAYPFADKAVLCAAAIGIVVATRFINDTQICVFLSDYWITSWQGVPVTLFLAFTAVSLQFNNADAAAAQMLIGAGLLIHLATQWHLVTQG